MATKAQISPEAAIQLANKIYGFEVESVKLGWHQKYLFICWKSHNAIEIFKSSVRCYPISSRYLAMTM